MPTTVVETLSLKGYEEYPQPAQNETPVTRAGRLKTWAENCLFYTSMYRMRRWALWRLADLFFDGDQTCLLPSNLGYAGTELSRLFQPDMLALLGDDMPARPVLNEFKDCILNESSRLNKSDYDPRVRPEGNDPGYQQRRGAKLATRALKSGLTATDWDEKKRVTSMHMPLYGGVWHLSRWETSLEDTTRIAVQGCVVCPQCQCKYAGPVPGQAPDAQACPNCTDHEETRPAGPLDVAQRAQAVDPTLADQMTGDLPPEVHAQLQAPITERVPGGPPLQPYTPVNEELSQQDAMGRPLGEDVPMGSWKLEVLWPGDMFEADFGIGMNGERQVRDFTTSRVRSLDYLRARYANARTEDLQPEDPFTLMMYHPVGGEVAEYDNRQIWRNHCREITRVKMPWLAKVCGPDGTPVLDANGKAQYKLNRGSVVTVAGGIAMEDSDLMLDGPDGKPFPRIKAWYTPHDVAGGGQQRDGSSLARQLFDPQRWINWSASMDVDEQRNGQSRVLLNRGANASFDSPDGTAMSVIYWGGPDLEGDQSQYKPQLLSRPSASVSPGAHGQYAQGFMDRASRKTEVEGGEVPGPTTPAQAMQIAREESGAVRKPRVQALAATYEEVYRHGLMLMQHYVREPRIAWDETDSGDEFQEFWTGADFQGQTDVRIDISGSEDGPVLAAQKLNDAIEKGVVNIQDPRTQRIVGREMGAPAEIYDAEDEQEAVAEREFLEFTRNVDPTTPDGLKFGRPPVVDDGIDNHANHAFRHTKDLQSDKWRQIEKLVDWDAIIVKLGPWRQQFAMMMMPQAVNGVPSLMPPGLDNLLTTPQLAIMTLWETILGQNGVQITPELESVLEFRAHNEEHQYRMKMANMPPMAAPAATPEPQQAAPPPK